MCESEGTESCSWCPPGPRLSSEALYPRSGRVVFPRRTKPSRGGGRVRGAGKWGTSRSRYRSGRPQVLRPLTGLGTLANLWFVVYVHTWGPWMSPQSATRGRDDTPTTRPTQKQTEEDVPYTDVVGVVDSTKSRFFSRLRGPHDPVVHLNLGSERTRSFW